MKKDMTMFRSCASSQCIAILLTAGYDDEFALSAVARMRDAGLPAYLISPSSNPIRGTHGIIVQPDHTLDEVYKQDCFQMVVFPGNRQCITTLLADPRTHTLVTNTLQASGYVAATKDTQELVAQVVLRKQHNHPQFLRQEGLPTNEFIQSLIEVRKRTKQPAKSLNGHSRVVPQP
ncbi:MAG: DJ-1/PfpI family protein [Anaerolineales bacterium]|nr:DJ-1/PfpI family protein [Anaerolineales bacterium]